MWHLIKVYSVGKSPINGTLCINGFVFVTIYVVFRFEIVSTDLLNQIVFIVSIHYIIDKRTTP